MGLTTIEIPIDDESCNKLITIAKENNVSIEYMFTKYLQLCVENNGWVVWENGFENPCSIIKTKEDAQAYLKKEGVL